jgi:RNA recognition motif-containing protein
MGKKLYVGNLPYTIDDQTLTSEFSKFGTVTSAKVITDRETGRSKGFGFVEMETDDQAESAISQLNGQPMGGRNINVSEAKPQTDRPRGGGSRFGGGREGGFRGSRGPRNG